LKSVPYCSDQGREGGGEEGKEKREVSGRAARPSKYLSQKKEKEKGRGRALAKHSCSGPDIKKERKERERPTHSRAAYSYGCAANPMGGIKRTTLR